MNILSMTIIAALGTSAQPSTPALTLEWDAPANCPGEDVVRRGIDGYLGRPARHASTTPVDAAVRVERIGEDRWVAEIRIETRSGVNVRTMTADRCETLADATSLIVAVALDPTAAGMTAPGDPEPATDPTPPQDPPNAVQTRASAPTSSDGSPSSGFAFAAGGLLIGALPSAAGGITFGLGLRRKALRVEARGSYWFPRPAELPDSRIAGQLALWTVGPRGCGVPSRGPVEFPLCGGVQAGQMRGRGADISDPVTDAVPWVAVEASAAATYLPDPHVGLTLGLDLAVPVVRPEFTVEGVGLAHRAAPAAGIAYLALEGRFP